MNAIDSLVLVALGFAPTLAALELSWRMGKMIGKRGELAAVKPK